MDSPSMTIAYANADDEDDRLVRHAHGRLERLRTMSLLERFLPPAPAKLADIGGGTGRYAQLLSERGYDVTMVDASEPLVERAQRRSEQATAPFAAIHGDARALSFPDNSFDAVIMLGPLYHLRSATDRRQALTECKRITVPGGPVIAAALSRACFAMYDGGLVKFLPEELDAHRAALASGEFSPPLAWADVYAHTPHELEDELAAAQLGDPRVLGSEGPLWASFLRHEQPASDDDATLQHAARVADILESEPSVIGASAHLLGVGIA